jgi:Holliday junction resolvase
VGLSILYFCIKKVKKCYNKTVAPLNRNYVSGARFERRVKEYYENMGYFVVRSAGSHSPVDLVAIKKNGSALFIQCKTDGKMSPKEKAELIAVSKKAGAIPLVAWRSGRTLKVIDVRNL